MLRKRLLAFCCLLSGTVSAQLTDPAEKLEALSLVHPIEKVYLHFDRDNYQSGDAMYFKAYLQNDYLPDTISTVLYVELLDRRQVVLNRAVLPVFNSISVGNLNIPDTLSTGDYLVRAFTPQMMNDTSGLLFRRPFFIFNGNLTKKNTTGAAAKPRMELFPEGGNLTEGLQSTVAFTLTDEAGNALSSSGFLLNDSNDTLARFSAFHEGMGSFDITPQAGQHYRVMLQNDSTRSSWKLPDAQSAGISFSAVPHPQGYFFEIHQRNTDPRFMAASMIGQMQHHVVFRQQFKEGKETIQGVLNTSQLLSGVLQVTVFNKDGIPLAERLCFVNNNEYRAEVNAVADTLSFSGKAPNALRLLLKDTIQASLSLSVTDAGYSYFDRQPENIISSMLLSNDLPGLIHNPAYYFTSTSDSVRTAADLLLMTKGWRRFNWTSLMQNPLPGRLYRDSRWIRLSGTVDILGTHKPFANRPVLLFVASADSSRSLQLLQTDENGQFMLDSLIFFGNTRMLITDIRGRKSKFIDVHLGKDSLVKNYPVAVQAPEWFTAAYRKNITAGQIRFDDFDEVLRSRGKMMDAVTVKARKKTPVEILEERYASGAFSGYSEESIDLTHLDGPITDMTIFEYLQYRVPGLAVQRDGINYQVYYRQTGPNSFSGNIPMNLFLNEVPVDPDVIASIPPNDIALVKVFNTFVGATGNGAGGAMAIYTKKGSDSYTFNYNFDDQFSYTGFTIRKEFAEPDYANDAVARSQPDHRITLQWKPDLLVTGINPDIPVRFYNNDSGKKFKLIAEGMTTDGKLIYLEKTFGPGAE